LCWNMQLERSNTSTIRAKELLSSVSPDRAFNFFLCVGTPSGVYADSLQAFSRGLQEVDARSVSFHMERRDIQNWIRKAIGDWELASKLSRLKPLEMSPEELRTQIYSDVKARLDELSIFLRNEMA
jgi:hypothetical protein